MIIGVLVRSYGCAYLTPATKGIMNKPEQLYRYYPRLSQLGRGLSEGDLSLNPRLLHNGIGDGVNSVVLLAPVTKPFHGNLSAKILRNLVQCTKGLYDMKYGH